jgi:tetratricopeptide (TPR) repeat protein
MKTKYILFLSALVSLTSCADFLEKVPQVNSGAETYYSNEAEANDAAVGMYAIQQNESFELGPFLYIGDNCSDDTDLGNKISEAYSWMASSVQAMQSFEVLPNNSNSNALWNQAFTGLNRATQLIARVEGNEAIQPESRRNQFVGEGYFMRAYYYFFLARQYGRMPIVDHVLTYEEYYMPRATMDETWQAIVDNLNKAIPLLPLKSKYAADEMGRATKGAAQALLGKTYIYWGKFQEAYDALKELEKSGEYDLEPNYADIFTLEHENGIESIYEIQHSISGTGWADANEGSILSFYEHNADPTDQVKWHNGWSMHCPTQDLVDSYETGDPRRAATIIFPGEMFDGHINNNASSSTGYQPKKWYVPYDQRSQEDQSDCPKNIIFMRYGDMLLYLAEAANELGKTTEALAYLEKIRDRARKSGDDPTVLPKITETGKDALRELIWKERRAELACEGQRFFDLCRQGRAGQVMRAYYAKYNPIDGTIKGKKFEDGKSELQPIPQSAITAGNGTMEQNPGYN